MKSMSKTKTNHFLKSPNRTSISNLERRILGRKSLPKGMYVEGNLLRETRQFSLARNKYTTNMLDNSSLAERFIQSRKSEEDYVAKEHKIGILTPLATTRLEYTQFLVRSYAYQIILLVEKGIIIFSYKPYRTNLVLK
jgi:hypothetical protein